MMQPDRINPFFRGLLAVCALAGMRLEAAKEECGAGAAEVLRRVPVGPGPESIARGFGDRYFVTLLGERRAKGDSDGKIVLVETGRVVPFADGFDNPRGLAYTGTEVITTDDDKVWGVDPLGRKRLIAGVKDFPEPPRGLNGVALMPDNDGVWVTGAGGVYSVVVEGLVKLMIPAEARLRVPSGISFIDEKTLHIGEASSGALLEWKDGMVRRVGGEFPGIEGVVRDGRGRVYVTERDSGRVWMLEPADGKRVLLAKLGTAGDPALDEAKGELAVPDTASGEIVFLRLPR